MGNIRHKWLASWMITEMKKKIYIYKFKNNSTRAVQDQGRISNQK